MRDWTVSFYRHWVTSRDCLQGRASTVLDIRCWGSHRTQLQLMNLPALTWYTSINSWSRLCICVLISLIALLGIHHHHQVARPAVSIAVSTTECHLERSCARSHAELRPRLVGCRSDSMVRSQVRRGRPLRRRQSVGRRYYMMVLLGITWRFFLSLENRTT